MCEKFETKQFVFIAINYMFLGGECNSGFTAFRQKCVKLYTSPADYSAAGDICTDEGGSLLTLDYDVEIQDIITLLSLSSGMLNWWG